MIEISKEILDQLKSTHPPGTRVRLVKMNDTYAPPPGTLGTIRCTDSIGTIHVNWDNGSSLGIVLGEDVFEKTTN